MVRVVISLVEDWTLHYYSYKALCTRQILVSEVLMNMHVTRTEGCDLRWKLLSPRASKVHVRRSQVLEQETRPPHGGATRSQRNVRKRSFMHDVVPL